MRNRANGTIRTFYILRMWQIWHSKNPVSISVRIYGQFYDTHLSKL